MSVIQKIRNKYGKLAGGVIALALVAFILMDAFNGKFGDYFGRDSAVAKVNGEKIDNKEYAERVKEYETLYGIYGGGRTIDDNTRAQLEEEALKTLVFEKLVAAQLDKLGITPSAKNDKDLEAELIYGPYPDPMIREYKIQGTPVFTNPETGIFDQQRVKAFEQQINQIDPTGKLKEEWETLKVYVKRTHLINTFSAMVVNSAFIPKTIIDEMAQDQKTKANVRFVKIPFTTINDNEVKVNDDDLKAYMQKHEALYRVTEPSRTIEYVSFDILPTQEDTARSLGALEKLKGDFASATDAESFVNHNSDEQYVKEYVNKKTFMSRYADSIMSTPIGSVYGPYFENGDYKMTKILDKKEMADSVKCRQILVRTKSQGTEILADTAAKQRMDSILTALKSGASFDSLVQKYSDDEASKKRNGEYNLTLVQRGQIPKEFGDFIFDGKKGEAKTVKVDNDDYSGYHYIEILDQSGIQPAAKLATVSKELSASDNTANNVYAKATAFAGKNNTAEAFDADIKKEGLNKKMGDNIKTSDFTVQGIGPSRELIRWVFSAKEGEVSPVLTIGNRYIVAKLNSMQKEGLQELTPALRASIEAAVKAEKKADLITNKYNSMKSLEAIAAAAGQQVGTTDSISGASGYIPNLGYEPKVLGYVFFAGLKPNMMSPAIKGNEGVYYIMCTNRWSVAPSLNLSMMLAQQQQQQQMQLKNTVSTQLQQELSRRAKIKYNPNNM